jgi:uncharacterized membrane protein
MRKIRISFIIGIILLITGAIIGQLAGHQHMSKGMLLGIIGFVLTGASGLTLLQTRKQPRQNKTPNDLLDSES